MAWMLKDGFLISEGDSVFRMERLTIRPWLARENHFDTAERTASADGRGGAARPGRPGLVRGRTVSGTDPRRVSEEARAAHLMSAVI